MVCVYVYVPVCFSFRSQSTVCGLHSVSCIHVFRFNSVDAPFGFVFVWPHRGCTQTTVSSPQLSGGFVCTFYPLQLRLSYPYRRHYMHWIIPLMPVFQWAYLIAGRLDIDLVNPVQFSLPISPPILTLTGLLFCPVVAINDCTVICSTLTVLIHKSSQGCDYIRLEGRSLFWDLLWALIAAVSGATIWASETSDKSYLLKFVT